MRRLFLLIPPEKCKVQFPYNLMVKIKLYFNIACENNTLSCVLCYSYTFSIFLAWSAPTFSWGHWTGGAPTSSWWCPAASLRMWQCVQPYASFSLWTTGSQWIEVRGIPWPVHDGQPLLFLECHHLLVGMAGRPVLEEMGHSSSSPWGGGKRWTHGLPCLLVMKQVCTIMFMECFTLTMVNFCF
jgi:hypothetical protein